MSALFMFNPTFRMYLGNNVRCVSRSYSILPNLTGDRIRPDTAWRLRSLYQFTNPLHRAFYSIFHPNIFVKSFLLFLKLWAFRIDFKMFSLCLYRLTIWLILHVFTKYDLKFWIIPKFIWLNRIIEFVIHSVLFWIFLSFGLISNTFSSYYPWEFCNLMVHIFITV